MQWTRDGQHVGEDSGYNEAVLVLREVTKTDAGLYTCQAENGVGSLAWQSTRVVVRCKYNGLALKT